jgi:hypothetical protein
VRFTSVGLPGAILAGSGVQHRAGANCPKSWEASGASATANRRLSTPPLL